MKKLNIIYIWCAFLYDCVMIIVLLSLYFIITNVCDCNACDLLPAFLLCEYLRKNIFMSVAALSIPPLPRAIRFSQINRFRCGDKRKTLHTHTNTHSPTHTRIWSKTFSSSKAIKNYCTQQLSNIERLRATTKNKK